MSEYGPEHRLAKGQKLSQMQEVACEVTGAKHNLEAHHSVPRLFNGPDHPSNYQILQQHFHQQVLHRACNIDDPKLIGKRVVITKRIAKHITDDEKLAELRPQMEDLDEVLIAEYISNMLNKLQHQYRERVLELTLVSSFKTIRDLNLENQRLRAQNALLKGESI